MTGEPNDDSPAVTDVPATVEPEPAEIVTTDEPDPATARVAGVEPGDPHAEVYDWLSSQFEPAAEVIDVASHGGSLVRAGLLPASADEELTDGLATMSGAAGHETPAELLSEFAARRFTYGRTVAERSQRLDELSDVLGRTARRLRDQTDRRDRAAVLVTLGDRLAALAVLLYDRYGDAAPTDAKSDDLPGRPDPRNARPNPRNPRRVARLLASADRLYPSPPEGGTLAAVPTAAVDELVGARQSLAVAVTTVAYARWDAPDGAWPLQFGYPVEFARPSPAAEIAALADYEPHGLWVDARAFDRALADRITRLRDGRYLARFRRIGRLYVRTLARLAGVSVPDDGSLADLVRASRAELPTRLGE